jgi:hypothetical protein
MWPDRRCGLWRKPMHAGAMIVFPIAGRVSNCHSDRVDGIDLSLPAAPVSVLQGHAGIVDANNRKQNDNPLDEAELRDLDAYWRACNYLAVGMIYLRDIMRINADNFRVMGPDETATSIRCSHSTGR